MVHRIARLVAVFALLVCVCAAAPAPARTLRHPIVIVGIDGLEWNVMLPMLREGRLPNLAGLMRRGVFGELETMQKTVSPLIWASVVTGVGPRKHGIDGFLCERPGADGAKRLCTSRDRQVKALWDIFGEQGLVTHVVGWWQTYPVEPIRGVMVAQTNTDLEAEDLHDFEQPMKGSLFAGVEGQVYPPERTERVLSVVAEVDRGLDENVRRIFDGAAETSDPIARKLWEMCIWAFRADAIYHRVALQLLEDDTAPADLSLVYFGGTDLVGHRFLRYWQPQAYQQPPNPAQVEAFRDVIPDYYQEMDRVLGEILARASADANVLVLSDHGMHPIKVRARYDSHQSARELRSGGHHGSPAGIFVASGPDIRPPRASVDVAALERATIPRVGSVLDVTPTVLALAGLPVARDMDGKILFNVLAAKPIIAWVDSYTPYDWQAERPSSSEEAGPAQDAERLEQLRSLGYID